MFKIYGGLPKFKQWSQNQKLSMKSLPVGSDIHFYNDPGEDDPLITEVYEITEGNGTVSRVCDVPNILLTDTRRIKVIIPETIIGPYGTTHKYAGGPREKYFEVEAAEQPVDYVYEETPLKGCGCSNDSGEVSEEKIETIVKECLDMSGVLPMGEGVTVWAEIVD